MLATMGNQEAEDGCLNGLETFDPRAPKDPRVDGNLRCTVEWLLAVWPTDRRYSAKGWVTGLYLSMTRTATVVVDGGMLRAGARMG